VVAFAATNIDDIVLLTIYFDQPNVRPQHVIVGQYLGFGALVGLSALGAIGVTLLPGQWAGALGLVPIALGIRGLLDHSRRTDTRPDPSSPDHDTTTATTGSAVIKVASVTFANCSDNLAVYVPLFASAGPGGLVMFVLVFLALVAVWCLVGYRLARNPIVAQFLQQRRRVVGSLVLIAIGLLILVESGLPLTLWRAAT
jgi:cadmium resistance protein CadD (predicted permease)